MLYLVYAFESKDNLLSTWYHLERGDASPIPKNDPGSREKRRCDSMRSFPTGVKTRKTFFAYMIYIYIYLSLHVYVHYGSGFMGQPWVRNLILACYQWEDLLTSHFIVF